jgi:hypothetical protein
MYSKTQNASRSPWIAIRVVIPRSSNVTTSPGSTSRRYFAPMMSNAHDSDATQ